ncbi:MAG: MHS family MFS transporter [Bifidobacteriaceae bacterium]|nr:MHS family MFS transporter [Bifidobacteriaceae bacterium]
MVIKVDDHNSAPRAGKEVSARVRLGRKSALAGFLGTALEYYDFFIYGLAASLTFGDIIFGGGKAAMLASFATFGVSYAARPFGGIILGHLGDKIGRRNILLFTIVLMGVSTFLIGCLPTFAQVGWLAPVLLVILRLAQGFSAGGESAGTSTLTMENAPANRRNFYSSFTITGCNLGIVLANAVFLPIQALPEAARMSWGWRVPFWLSAVIMVVAYVLRRTLMEPEVFTEVKKERKTAKLPLGELLRTDWPTLVKCIIMMLVCATDTAFMVFALSFGTNTVGVPSTVMLVAVIIGMAVGMIGQPLAALLSDTIGRKPVFVVGCLLCASALFIYFQAIMSKNALWIILAAVFYRSIAYSCVNAIYIGWFPELFEVRVRYSGAATGIQVGLLAAGFTPMISQALVPSGSTNWLPIPIYLAVLCLASGAAALFSRETFKTPLDQLGPKRKETTLAAG